MNNSVSFVLSVVEEIYNIYEKIECKTGLIGWSGIVVDHDIDKREWTRVSILYTSNKPEKDIVRGIINMTAKYDWEIWEESDGVSQIRIEIPTRTNDIFFLQGVIDALKSKYPIKEIGVLKFPQNNNYSLFMAKNWG